MIRLKLVPPVFRYCEMDDIGVQSTEYNDTIMEEKNKTIYSILNKLNIIMIYQVA